MLFSLKKIINKSTSRMYFGIFLAVFCCLFFVINLNHVFAATKTETQIINKNNLDELQKTTDLTTEKVQELKGRLTVKSIKPEITIPAEGGSVSGKNLLIKGVATPNANVDVLIETVIGVASPILGKTTSDKYGVWTYSLGPDLKSGSYNLRVTAQVGSETPLRSDLINFTVITPMSSTGNSISESIMTGTSSNNSFLIIIITVIISITFLIVVIVLSVAPYARSHKSSYAERMKAWSAPELATMNEAEWKNFVGQMEFFRNSFIAPTKSKNKPIQNEVPLESVEVASEEVRMIEPQKVVKVVVENKQDNKIELKQNQEVRQNSIEDDIISGS